LWNSKIQLPHSNKSWSGIKFLSTNNNNSQISFHLEFPNMICSTTSGQLGFKVQTWQLGSTLMLTSTLGTRNSTSVVLGPNDFPHVVMTTTIMTISAIWKTNSTNGSLLKCILACLGVNAHYGGSFFKLTVFHKSPCFSVKFLIFCGTIG
jgi:hypothetical protein